MHLTAFTNYALRTLMFAALKGDALSQVDEIARAHRIPRSHVVKCVHQLGRWGYIENLRGRGGGFRLARPAANITVGEVVRRTEDGLRLVECFDPASNTCPLCGACELSRGIGRALAPSSRSSTECRSPTSRPSGAFCPRVSALTRPLDPPRRDQPAVFLTGQVLRPSSV